MIYLSEAKIEALLALVVTEHNGSQRGWNTAGRVSTPPKRWHEGGSIQKELTIRKMYSLCVSRLFTGCRTISMWSSSLNDMVEILLGRTPCIDTSWSVGIFGWNPETLSCVLKPIRSSMRLFPSHFPDCHPSAWDFELIPVAKPTHVAWAISKGLIHKHPDMNECKWLMPYGMVERCKEWFPWPCWPGHLGFLYLNVHSVSVY